jgi:hypothetical protein
VSDYSELVERLQSGNWTTIQVGAAARVIEALAAELAARDAACGHLPGELVAKLLAAIRGDFDNGIYLDDDEDDALRAATFEVTE